MNLRCLAVSCTLLLLPFTASAVEVPIKPGLWETTMTRTNPMTGDPTTETTQECIKQNSFSPSEMMKNAEGCELIDENLDGSTLTFQMECSMQGSKATVDGTFQTEGDTGKGNMTMEMNMGEMSMDMEMDWTSKRLGDC